MRRVPFALLVPALLAACNSSPPQEAAGAAGPDSVAMALEQYKADVFDTITWSTDTAQTNRGAVVWTVSCAKCHGVLAKGDGGFVLEGDTLVPPDFTQPGWRLATDRAELMKYIYAGNSRGMPHWGIQGLKPRNVDAVSAYIQKMLLPPSAAPTQ